MPTSFTAPLTVTPVVAPRTFTAFQPPTPSNTWHWVVNNFSSSGPLQLEPGKDPKVAACEWAKAHLPYGLNTEIEAWHINATGDWDKAFVFNTDASFWTTDCAAWVIKVKSLSGALGQHWQGPSTISNWTGVPEPPWWPATGMPWPPMGAFPTEAPPLWKTTGLEWPPPKPPGYPEDWPYPLPLPPGGGPSPPAPPAGTQPPLPPPPAPIQPAPSGVEPGNVGVALLVVAGITLLTIIILR